MLEDGYYLLTGDPYKVSSYEGPMPTLDEALDDLHQFIHEFSPPDFYKYVIVYVEGNNIEIVRDKNSKVMNGHYILETRGYYNESN